MVPARAPDGAATEAVAWRADPDPRPRTLLRYAGVGLFGGVALAALALLVFVAVSTLAGDADAETDASSPSAAPRGALVALGVLVLGVAAAVLARGEGAAPVVVYGVLALGGLGVFVVALAWRA